MRHWICAVAALGVVATTPVAAQTATVDPGMSRAEVIETLGKPIGERSTGQYVYLFYRNNCEARCGMHDLVILQNDLVVDAIFRSSRRAYSGASSSPNGVTPEASGSGTLRTREGAENENSAPSRSSGEMTPERGAGSTSTGPRGGTVRGTTSSSSTETPTTGGATIMGAGVISTPAGATVNRPAGPPLRRLDTTRVLDGVPPNPRDTSTIQPSRTQGQLTPSARDQQPIPFSGSKPSPRDSAIKDRTGQKPDTVKPPEE